MKPLPCLLGYHNWKPNWVDLGKHLALAFICARCKKINKQNWKFDKTKITAPLCEIDKQLKRWL